MADHPSYEEGGVKMVWDAERRAYFPEINESMYNSFQNQYVVSTEPLEKAEEWELQHTPDGKPYYFHKKSGRTQWNNPIKPPETKEKEKEKPAKRKNTEEEHQFFQLKDEENPNVYVSGLPEDITEVEFEALMSRCGIIAEDQDGNKKIKLYRTESGALKGDGRCCYLKVASVLLALQVLDGSTMRGRTISVSRAVFEKKSVDASRLPQKSKRKKKPTQAKLLSWSEADNAKALKLATIVVIKHMFTPEEFDKDPVYLSELKLDVQSECEKFGTVKKILIFDRNPEGVLSVRFEDIDAATRCISVMNGRFFAGRKLEAFTWDGVTDYKVEETDEQREERIRKWEAFIEQEDAKADALAAAAAAAATGASSSSTTTATTTTTTAAAPTAKRTAAVTPPRITDGSDDDDDSD